MNARGVHEPIDHPGHMARACPVWPELAADGPLTENGAPRSLRVLT
jgi:hypothetical protein